MAERLDLRFLFVGLILLAVCLPGQASAQEVLYPSEAFAKLDTFEAIAVEDADKLFIKGDYPGAYAAYKAYSIEFAQNGEALPDSELPDSNLTIELLNFYSDQSLFSVTFS